MLFLGYVQQDDLFILGLTVREHLCFQVLQGYLLSTIYNLASVLVFIKKKVKMDKLVGPTYCDNSHDPMGRLMDGQN